MVTSHFVMCVQVLVRRAAVALGVVLIFAVPHGAVAQTSAQKAKAPTSGTKAAPTTPGRTAPVVKAAPATTPAAGSKQPPQWTAEEAAARDKVLNGQPWNQMMHDFNQWLSAQPLYDAEEVKRIRTRLDIGVGRMSATQLERFLYDMQEKLQVLTGAQAQQASAYLAQTFAVASPAYAKRIRQKLPDVLTMTAAQINQQLAIFASKQQATVDMQKSFEDSRSQSIAYNQQQLAAQERASEAALSRAESGAASGSKGNNYTAARDYFPNAGNDGPFGPGTSIGLGWGFF